MKRKKCTRNERTVSAGKGRLPKLPFSYYCCFLVDLLDNFLEPSTARHRASTQSSSTVNDSVSDCAAQSYDAHQRKLSSRAGSDAAGSVDANEDIEQEEEHAVEQKPAKDQYLVEVDVDVDGVMMDGLDQLEYQSRLGQDESGRQRSYYRDQKGDNQAPNEEEEMEPISRTLEALALEGLGD